MAVDLYHVTAIPQLDGYDITGAGQIDGPLVRRITPSFVVRAPASLHLDCSRLPSPRDDARNQPRARRGYAGDTIGGLPEDAIISLGTRSGMPPGTDPR